MRKGFRILVAFCFVVIVAVQGCHQCGPAVSAGYGAHYYRPPIVKVETPMLAGGSQGFAATGQGIAGMTGPALGTEIRTVNPAPLAMPQAAPCQERPERLSMPREEPRRATLTCEEWCELMRRVQREQSAEPQWKALPKPKE